MKTRHSLYLTLVVACGLVGPSARGGVQFTNLVSFDYSTNGGWPASLTVGTDGNFYGGAFLSGYGFEELFRMTPDGTLTPIYTNHQSGAGFLYYGGMVHASDGHLYGCSHVIGSN